MKKSIGKRISEFRHQRGFTQRSLAEALGVTDKSVSKWERELSCPDISLLPDIAKLFGVSVDALLNEESSAQLQSTEAFLSLEKYLMGRFGYFVPDLHPKNERVILLLDYPDLDDARHGYALSGKMGVEINKFLFGKEEASSLAELLNGTIGVSYISNVPLGNLNPPIDRLVDELEFTRLNRYHVDPFLMEGFSKKLSDILENNKHMTLAITREFNQKYFFTFLARCVPNTAARFQRRIAEGNLKLLFIAPPYFFNKSPYHEKEDLLEFRRLILNAERTE